MKKITPLLIVFLALCKTIQSTAQHTHSHHVNFNNVDGFSGYVEFTTKYTGFATQLSADNIRLVINHYNTSTENLEALLNAGYDLRGGSAGVTPPGNYGYEITGNAYIVSGSGVHQASQSKLHINKNLGEKMVTPEFSDDVPEIISQWRKIHNENLWETTGNFINEKVVALYIPEFKEEISQILSDYKAEKERAEKEKAGDKKKGGKTKKSDKKSTTAKNDTDKDKKPKAKEKTISDYALEERVKGDEALKRGNYKAAERHYNKARAMGAIIDQDKMQQALNGSMAESLSELFSYIPSEDETLSAFTLTYYNDTDYWENYTLAWSPETYWGNFFIQWNFNVNYTKGKMWINQQAPKIAFDKVYSKKEETQVFMNEIRNQLPPDDVLFYDTDGSYTDYTVYKYKQFESIGGGLEFGLGYRIPIASDGGIGLPLGGVGFLNIANYSSNLGYRFFTGLDFSRLFFRISFAQLTISATNFNYGQLSKYKGNSHNSLDKLEELTAQKKAFSTLQFSIGIYL